MSVIKNLSTSEVASLQSQYGYNELSSGPKFSAWEIFFNQFLNPFIYVLAGVLFISLLLREYFDAALSGILALVNISMGFYQEYSAQKTLHALKKILKPTTFVLRDGKRQVIEILYLVPGDIVYLSSGDKVPADGELIEGVNLLANEAIITGEEEALEKDTEKNNQLFMGSTIISGKGTMKVLAIGEKTKIGQIGKSLSEIKEEKTPLQIKLDKLVQYLLWLVLFTCVVIFVLGIFHHEELWHIFKLSIVLSVAAIPEGLPIAITVILALGMRRILHRKGLVRRLLAIETLGLTSVICTDKTGTLTEGKMQVTKINTINKEDTINALVLANGQKTNLELCLLDYARKEGFDVEKILQNKPLREEPFSSEKKYAVSSHNINNKKIAYILGAPEIVLSFCKESPDEIEEIKKEIDEWANEGLRLLGAAFKNDGELKEKKNYTWLSLIGIRDPLRAEAKDSIQAAIASGISVKIVTGDYLLTAKNVAHNLNLDVSYGHILEGKDLDRITDKELRERIDEVNVFARVNPDHKLKIIQALRQNGEIVAMIGDGVNDAPALKQADIGVSVGDGTDVAKEASDLILLDNNFATILAACEEGRVILRNIKKVVGYVLSNSFAEIVLIFGAILLNLPAPLTVVLILWIQLICDGPPDIILGFEPKEKDIMKETPKKLQKENILSKKMQLLVLAISGSIGLLALVSYKYFLNSGDMELARTVAFAIVSSASLIYIFAFRNLKKIIIRSENFWQNYYLFGAVIYGFALIFAAIYLPVFNNILKTKPLGIVHWLVVLGVGVLALIIVELAKILNNRIKENRFD